MTSTLALLILFCTTLVVLANLRVLLQDTCAMLTACASRARDSGQMISRGAFVTLWLLIFFLSFF